MPPLPQQWPVAEATRIPSQPEGRDAPRTVPAGHVIARGGRPFGASRRDNDLTVAPPPGPPRHDNIVRLVR